MKLIGITDGNASRMLECQRRRQKVKIIIEGYISEILNNDRTVTVFANDGSGPIDCRVASALDVTMEQETIEAYCIEAFASDTGDKK